MVRPEIAVGGIGGSGTRLIARFLIELGWHMGEDLNDANDNLAFTLLFKRAEVLGLSAAEFDRLVEVFVAGMTRARAFSAEEQALIGAAAALGRAQHPRDWLQARAAALLAQSGRPARSGPWGWKEPNTHVVLERLYAALPNMKYVHVMRNGVDMAYSSNQNQPRLWGSHYLGGSPQQEISPDYSLRYWCAVHRRIFEVAALPGNRERFLFLNFDRLCGADPRGELDRLLAFLELAPSPQTIERLLGMIARPASIGRGRAGGLQAFAAADVAYVAELGFEG